MNTPTTVAARRCGPTHPVEPGDVDAMLRMALKDNATEDVVVGNFGDLTGADVDRRADAVAWRLRDMGVRVGDRVAVVSRWSEWLPAIVVGVIRAGAAYVPIDPAYPGEHISYVLDDANPAALILAGGASVAVSPVLPVLDVGDTSIEEALLANEEPFACEELDRPIDANDPVYVIYTSGTTGRPKGVLNGHRAVASHLQTMSRVMSGVDVRVLLKAPIGFDVGVGEILIPLASRGTLIMPDAEWHLGDAEGFVRMLLEYRVTVLAMVPSLLRTMFGLLDDLGVPLSIFGEIEELLLGGEAVPSDLVERARSEIGCRVHGLYGPSETAMDVAWVEYTEELTLEDGVHLLGRPEDNTVFYVLDENGVEVINGEPGELYIAGAQVGIGYLGLPDLTADVFLPSLNPEFDGGRMYRTGDLVQWDGGGMLRFLGRIGDQVKIRGNRVELGEVEARLRRLPGVADAAVAVFESGGAQALTGYVVAEPGEDLDPGVLARTMAISAPAYLVPSRIIPIAEIPTTPNGKLDRKALPTP